MLKIIVCKKQIAYKNYILILGGKKKHEKEW